MIDGKDAQSNNEEMIAKALQSTDQIMRKLGFHRKVSRYYDNNENPVRDEDTFWKYLDENKTRFLPKGVYSISQNTYNPDYAGKKSLANVFYLKLGDKTIAQAIHGFYQEPVRREYFDRIQKMIKSGVSQEAVSKEYLNFVRKNYNKVTGGNMSHGCVNVPLTFLEEIRPYAIGAFVFVIGSGDKGFLVDNSQEFFKRTDVSNNVIGVASSMANDKLGQQSAVA